MDRRRPLSWLAVLAVAAAATVGCRSAANSASVTEHPLLWAAQKDGKTTYLLGTMHIGFNAEKQLPTWVWDKVRAATSVAIETDPTDPVLMSAALRRDGGSLRDELGDVYWRKLEAQIGPSAKEALRMTPAAAAALIELQGIPATMPMDLMLFGEAKASDKKLVYLEPAARQLEILTKWVDLRMLKASIDERASGGTSSRDLLDAYVSGDIKRIEAMGTDRSAFKKTGRPDADYDAMMEELLFARNAAWIPAIETMHQDSDGLVAVGAMHLIGTRSVLELLQQRGFTISRVSAPRR
jgi:uncharacterized protein